MGEQSGVGMKRQINQDIRLLGERGDRRSYRTWGECDFCGSWEEDVLFVETMYDGVKLCSVHQHIVHAAIEQKGDCWTSQEEA